MAKYLDEAGLSTLWGKIKDTFVAKTIKKSDSSNATQITHNGDTVSLSRGTISGTGNTSTYTKKSSIDIIGDDIIFTANHRPMYKTGSGEDPKNLVISSDIATSSTAGLVKSTTTGTTTNRDYYVQVNSDGTMKVNVPWTDNNTTYTIATSSTPGLVKLVSDEVQSTSANSVTSTSSRTYAIQKNSSNQLVVNVPWTDTKTTVDSALSSTSTNPVQNKVIYTALTSYFVDEDLWHEGQIMVASGQGSMTASNVDINDITDDITNLKNTITGLSGAMHFKGKFDNLPAVTNYSAGDVCIIGTKEYVLNDNSGTKTWVELGDEGSHINKSIFTAKGDIIYASGAGTPTRLGIGANGKVLKVVSGIPSWADDINTHNTHIIYSGKKTDGTDISSGTASSGNITLGDSGVTAGNYGDTSNQMPSYGGAFTVPSITVNAKGIVTGISTHTVKIPASDNINTSHSHNVGVGLIGSGNAGTTGGTYTYKVSLRDERVASYSSTYTAGGSTKFYAVQLDKDNKLSVYVPWTDTNTTYTAGTGLSLSGTTFSINTNYVATKSANGLMSKDDKTKLDNFEGAISVDDINALS